MMKDPKMFSLAWDNYSTSLSNSAKELMNDNDFLDVTLAFDDDQQIQVSKFMLSICSPFFKRILKRNAHSHPLLYLKGIKSENMRKMIDFIYNGETCVPENDLEIFLANAHDLQLKGLTQTSNIIDAAQENNKNDNEEHDGTERAIRLESELDYIEPEVQYLNDCDEDEQNNDISLVNNDDDLEISIVETYTDENQALSKSFINDNMLVENGMFICKECGKVFAKKQILANHIEIHMGIKHECVICQKSFKTKNSLKSHISQRHKSTDKS